jgi:hypothetical protein
MLQTLAKRTEISVAASPSSMNKTLSSTNSMTLPIVVQSSDNNIDLTIGTRATITKLEQ